MRGGFFRKSNGTQAKSVVLFLLLLVTLRSVALAESDDPILLPNPITFEGRILAGHSGHRMVRAENGMFLGVPLMALVWKGDRTLVRQDVSVGRAVKVHLRADQPYRIVARQGSVVWLGGYDGVFLVSEEFLDHLREGGLPFGIAHKTPPVGSTDVPPE